MTRLNDEQLNALFNEPRTVNAFTEQPVTDEQLQKIYELAAMGPTAFNSQPLRITWVKTPEARERLVKHMMDGNKEKTLNAPVTAVLASIRTGRSRFGGIRTPGRCLRILLRGLKRHVFPRRAELCTSGWLLPDRRARSWPGCGPHDWRGFRWYRR